jgi:hypothetical protein
MVGASGVQQLSAVPEVGHRGVPQQPTAVEPTAVEAVPPDEGSGGTADLGHLGKPTANQVHPMGVDPDVFTECYSFSFVVVVGAELDPPMNEHFEVSCDFLDRNTSIKL